MSNKALQLLNKRRDEVIKETQILERELIEIDNAIAKIEGRSIMDMIYDDENPDYIKGTEDGI
jgi:hypothetical protein